MSQYARTVEKLNQIADEPDELPCRYCGRLAPRDSLAAFGARCRPCYEDYLRAGPSSNGFMTGRPDTIAQREMRARVKPGKQANVLGDKT